MIAWNVFRRGVGCLSLLMTFCLGLITGFVIFWVDNATTPYINRQTAIRYALENAQGHCSDRHNAHPVDCVHFRLIDSKEDEDGWHFVLQSRDGRRTDSMFIGRKGEYDSTGVTDMDDPNALPVQTFINGKPVGPPS